MLRAWLITLLLFVVLVDSRASCMVDYIFTVVTLVDACSLCRDIYIITACYASWWPSFVKGYLHCHCM